MGGVFARVIYALVLAGVLAAATWASFSRFVAGKSMKVPDFTNLTPEEASILAAERGLLVKPDPSQEGFDDRVPAHKVRGQSPAADTAVKSGQTVRLFVSLGPRTLRVPDLSGTSARTAALSLAKNGLREGLVATARLPGPSGVIGQGAAPGSVAAPESAVDVLVNRGGLEVAYVMPDLIGRDVDRVRTAFEARGFRIGGVKSQAYEGAAGGTILRQFPLAGSPLTYRDTLSFVIASSETSP
jgi:eukaryotic-like serine/threonine-protein kinase